MIPKKIHYCWFGGKPLPDNLKKFIESWKNVCPDYEIIEWNETNFDYSKYRYSREAFEIGQWAFVSDVARLEAIYNYGGIYLDTDVEIIKPFDDLLNFKSFIGAEDMYDINTGAAFGAEPNNKIILENLMEYKDKPLIYKGKVNKITCVEITTAVLKRHGLKRASKVQNIHGMIVFPMEYFSPLALNTNKLKVTENTYSIHHYKTNWKERSSLKKLMIRRTVPVKKISRRKIDELFGEGTYNKIKIELKKITSD